MGEARGINRRNVTAGLAALAGMTMLPRAAQATEGMHSITTSVGTYDIPDNPQRVIAVDHRLDLEPALILGLNVIGYSLRDNLAAWVPVAPGTRFIGTPPTRELLLSENPDLIFCTDIPGSEMWPIDKLKDVAPVIPIDYEMSWKDNLRRAGEWLNRSDKAEAFLTDYEARLANLRETVGDKVKGKVAAIWFDATEKQVQVLLGYKSINVTLAGQVLDDLGGRTVDPALLGEYGIIALESLTDALADVDGIMVDAYEDADFAALNAIDIWQRVPAVAAGKVYRTTGAYYGAGYSAMRLVEEWSKLYALL